MLAGRALDEDGNLTLQTGVASNGFGLIGRIVGIAVGDRNLAAGLGYYAAARPSTTTSSSPVATWSSQRHAYRDRNHAAACANPQTARPITRLQNINRRRKDDQAVI
jgi:hypothetical protein